MNQENNNLKKCPICGRPTHKESKYCIFHASAEEKSEEEFKKALKEYVDKIKKEDGNYDFSLFIFIGNMGLKSDLDITIFKNANFEGATFEGDAEFNEAAFEGDANFNGAAFEGDAYFGGATFEGYADFSVATFKGDANFDEATFNKHAYFDEATFNEYACFGGAAFKGNVYFEGAAFKGYADFELKYLDNIIDFSKIKIFPGKKLSINIINEGKKIIFNLAYLENAYLDIELVEGVLIDFTDALLKNTKINKEKIENHIIQEKEKKFFEAKEIFLLLKNNYHSIGRYNDESWAYKKEKDMERKSLSFSNYKKSLKDESKKEKYPILKWIKNDFEKWIISGFSNIIYGYGERPGNVIKTAVAIILIFALSFSFIGLGNPEIIELKGTAIHQNSGNIVDLASKGLLKNNVIRNFPDSLYFSLITFTTLGYGDFRPLEGWGRFLAGSEAFIGALMMALFVYTFARRTGGR